jgi:hypothetical protein
MKRVLLLLSVLILMAVSVTAADTNLNQSITVERPLEDVIRAMQAYYFSTNHQGSASAVSSTNAVPGVSYTLGVEDCAFDPIVGTIAGDMIATRVTARSTRLEFVFKHAVLTHIATRESSRQAISKTLGWVSKIAEGKR